MPRRKAISTRLRFQILERDGFVCQYCGARPPDAVLEVDHFKPVIDGGTNAPDNLITACSRCNKGKGPQRTPEASEINVQAEIHAAAQWTRHHRDHAPTGENLPAFLAGWLARAAHGR